MATACPRCGVAVELPVLDAAGAPQICTLCGFRNSPDAATCESCGARLAGVAAGGSVQRKGAAEKPVRPASARAKGGRQKKEGRSRFEPWQVVSAVAVLALVVVVVYLLVQGDQGSAPRTVPSSDPQAAASMAQIDALQQAVDANPRDTATRLRLANLLHDHGMLPRAIDHYNEYLELEPTDPNARVDLGICYDQLALQDSLNAPRYFALAVREMETVAKNSPTHQPAAFNLGIVNLHMGNLEDSNKWFKRAVELDRSSELGKRAQNILQQHTFPQ